MRLLVLPELYCSFITHLNGWNGRQYVSRWSPCFGFFVCPCYSRRTHYPTLENPGVQNIAACENQGKQRQLSDHWKSTKTLFLKKKIHGDDAKKTKILTEIQVLTEEFTSYKIRYVCKKKKVTGFVKWINYWEITANTWSN